MLRPTGERVESQAMTDQKLVTKTSDLPPLQLSPHGQAAMTSVAEDSGKVGAVSGSLSLLAKHADPIVRAIAENLAEPIAEWAKIKTSRWAIRGGGFDHYDLPLSTDLAGETLLTIGGHQNSAVQITGDEDVLAIHVRIGFDKAIQSWVADTSPGRSIDPASTTWPRFRWWLNGEQVETGESRPVKVGDEIRVGHSIVHLR
jgi:hypothetical protein